ncbi:MAG: PhoH family protein, partial [Myxococcales bacterium]|nr:PhoH family protein [Myxococcales bacterium]
MTTTTTLRFDDRDAFQQLCGPNDKNLKIVEQLLQVEVNARGNTLALSGEDHDVTVAGETLDQFYELARSGFKVFSADIPRGVRIVSTGHGTRLADVFLDTVFVAGGKKKIAPKNLSQKHYIDAIREHDLVFGIGAAGTGKTYLA